MVGKMEPWVWFDLLFFLTRRTNDITFSIDERSIKIGEKEQSKYIKHPEKERKRKDSIRDRLFAEDKNLR